jgi:uncharacterized membrane protein
VRGACRAGSARSRTHARVVARRPAMQASGGSRIMSWIPSLIASTWALLAGFSKLLARGMRRRRDARACDARAANFVALGLLPWVCAHLHAACRAGVLQASPPRRLRFAAVRRGTAKQFQLATSSSQWRHSPVCLGLRSTSSCEFGAWKTATAYRCALTKMQYGWGMVHHRPCLSL